MRLSDLHESIPHADGSLTDLRGFLMYIARQMFKRIQGDNSGFWIDSPKNDVATQPPITPGRIIRKILAQHGEPVNIKVGVEFEAQNEMWGFIAGTQYMVKATLDDDDAILSWMNSSVITTVRAPLTGVKEMLEAIDEHLLGHTKFRVPRPVHLRFYEL